MGRHRLLLVACFVLSSACVHAADDTYPIPQNWDSMVHPPLYDAYYTQQNPTEAPQSSTLLRWHKIVFKQDQPSPGGPFRSEVVLLQVKCDTHTVAIMREILYSSSGAVVSDRRSSPTEARTLDFYKEKSQPLLDAAISGLASFDADLTCYRGE